MTTYFVDFETRSVADLKKTNAWGYSRHPSTDVMCMAFAKDDEPVQLWTPADGVDPLHGFLDDIYAGDAAFIAHNVKFEYSIWKNVLEPKYGFPPLIDANIHDTMALAYAMALPGSLEGAANALGLSFQKDKEGHALMLRMSRPRSMDKTTGEPIWWEDPDRLERLYAYCKQDVEVEREIYRRTLKLSTAERQVFLLDHRINHRGVPIDRAACHAVIKAVDAAVEGANVELEKITKGKLTSGSQVTAMVTLLRDLGVPVEDVASATVDHWLERDDIDPLARRILEIRKIASKSSTKKINAMLNCADTDDRVRQTTAYHGASTGRWAGRDVQVQNFPRPKLKQPQIEDVIERLSAGESPDLIELFYGPIPEVAASSLRGLIKAGPGNDFVSADFSNIEGRVLAWLAGEEKVLQAFRDYDAGTGHDLYKITAGGILGKEPADVTDDERQAYGKVPSLACGFQGALGAFQAMAKIYRVSIPDEKVLEVVRAWREYNSKIVEFWYALERAALNALRNPGEITAARRIRFRKAGAFLFAQLPSGRCLAYPYAEIAKKDVPWSDTPKDAVRFKSVSPVTRQWGWTDTYGGSLAENVTQAVARDFLAEALVRLETAGYPVVMHVHDEVVSEVPEDFGSLDEFTAIMSEVPAWGEGCPISVAGWRGKRYRK